MAARDCQYWARSAASAVSGVSAVSAAGGGALARRRSSVKVTPKWATSAEKRSCSRTGGASAQRGRGGGGGGGVGRACGGAVVVGVVPRKGRARGGSELEKRAVGATRTFGGIRKISRLQPRAQTIGHFGQKSINNSGFEPGMWAPSRRRHVTNGPKLKGFCRKIPSLDFSLWQIKGSQGPLICIKGCIFARGSVQSAAFCRGAGAKMHPLIEIKGPCDPLICHKEKSRLGIFRQNPLSFGSFVTWPRREGAHIWGSKPKLFIELCPKCPIV